MKTRIQRVLYNTEAARLLGSRTNNLPESHQLWIRESLYYSRSRRYFLHCEGGPESKYAMPSGRREWVRGERIIPLTLKDAQDWAKDFLPPSVYDIIFRDVEDDRRVSMHLYIKSSTKARLDRMSEETLRPISQIVDEKFSEKP